MTTRWNAPPTQTQSTQPVLKTSPTGRTATQRLEARLSSACLQISMAIQPVSSFSETTFCMTGTVPPLKSSCVKSDAG